MNYTSLCMFLLLLFITSTAGVSMEPRCRCSGVESRRIGKFINRVELLPPNPHCAHTEIIATLKKSGTQICLDTNAPWVMKVINKIISMSLIVPPA